MSPASAEYSVKAPGLARGHRCPSLHEYILMRVLTGSCIRGRPISRYGLFGAMHVLTPREAARLVNLRVVEVDPRSPRVLARLVAR